ncbi:hypothetical protein POVWA2_056840 [Plasmodium ovale wallikeri]|uniref:Uncharacterized protein n=2 Tax=Plasmodium ovale TaxID=36330 RepID=A0A1A8ZYD8_PLAOA|nr:hypothetical protein POVWA1_057490 [Plasmodium ovale wallikeri]SBT48851.1 hypothetical protein POVWA2_056840 [Plasmodium ovale wallikeri]SBT82470.1 conserved Plasmodium protein, unknown function [Plasmodium ovale]
MSLKRVAINEDQMSDIPMMYAEDDVFSNSSLSDVDNSYEFWKKIHEGYNSVDQKTERKEGNIFDISEDFESSDDEIENNDVRGKSDMPPSNCSIEINTSPVQSDTMVEETCGGIFEAGTFP